MSEIIRIAGFDPGLRFTGYGVVNYDTEKNEIWVSNAGLAKKKSTVKGIDGLSYMKTLLRDVTNRECFADCDKIVVEVPAAVFFKNFSAGALIPVAVVSGMILQMFDNDRLIPVYPASWNGGRKKDNVKHRTYQIVGPHEDWLFDDAPRVESQFEHIIDAVSMALWCLETKYLDGQ